MRFPEAGHRARWQSRSQRTRELDVPPGAAANTRVHSEDPLANRLNQRRGEKFPMFPTSVVLDYLSSCVLRSRHAH